jgi:hypothetical protein
MMLFKIVGSGAKPRSRLSGSEVSAIATVGLALAAALGERAATY